MPQEDSAIAEVRSSQLDPRLKRHDGSPRQRMSYRSADLVDPDAIGVQGRDIYTYTAFGSVCADGRLC